ncbi:MAG: hypothetical protein M1830_004648 [Pleopsidium flavum]|nr:MAG: hypothetical protein M1830_004648 [Pleopsidium flavum]
MPRPISLMYTNFLRRSTALLKSNPSASDATQLPNGTVTTAPEGALFPKVDPSIDGEDCEHDCQDCSIKYPPKWSIDEEEELYGHVKGWSTHLLVATGKTDWSRDVEDEKGSVMEVVVKGGVKPNNGRLMLSASNMPPPKDHHDFPKGERPTTVLLLPSFTIIDNVTPASVPELIHHFIDNAPTTTTPLHLPSPPSKPTTNGTSSEPPPIDSAAHFPPLVEPITIVTPSKSPVKAPISHPFSTRPCPHLAIILLCSQKTRDARCGQSAPLLRRELERQLRPLGLYRDFHDERPGGVGIYFISHVGGHKFAANVMVYRRGGIDEKNTGGEDSWVGEATQGIWLARVRPEDCEGIVKFTVLEGKVVKPERQLRGGFDRAKGLVSW